MNIDKLNNALVNACNRNMGLAASWYARATNAMAQGQTLNGFVCHTTRSNRRVARAAYLLANGGVK